MENVEVGQVFCLRDERSGRVVIGFGRTIDEAVSDAVHRYNEIRRSELSVKSIVRSFLETES